MADRADRDESAAAAEQQLAPAGAAGGACQGAGACRQVPGERADGAEGSEKGLRGAWHRIAECTSHRCKRAII